jgi:hypothetical protein
MMHRARLGAAALLVGFAFAAFPAIASADVSFTDAAQEAFGVDADGNVVEGSDRSGTFRMAWDEFIATDEGQRIFKDLDDESVDLTIDFKPEAEVGSDGHEGEAFATAQGLNWEEDETTGIDKPTEIKIEIADDTLGGAERISNTIHHEFRHAENNMNGNYSRTQERIDDRTDSFGMLFRNQRRAQLPPSATPFLIDRTPHWDRLQDELWADESVGREAKRLGEILGDYVDSDSANADKFEAQPKELTVDIELYDGYLKGMSGLQVQLDFNESILECGEVTDGRRTVCAANPLPMPEGQVFVAAAVMAGEIPQGNSDRHYVYSLVLDSDGQAGNNWVGFLDWDLFLGTDRWYQLIWSPVDGQWRVTVTQVGPNDVTTTVTSSTVRATIEGDTISWWISASEFPAAAPGYRLTSFAHDGFYTVADRIADVTGADPTEPLLVPDQLE